MNRPRHRSQSGQVLITGLIMLVILLIAIFFLFDLHNVIRAKLKTETAQQSAALAAAEWQKESLNLIGEINLIKACESLLEDDSRWRSSAAQGNNPASTADDLARRIDLLTEMQVRIGFLGPLIGFGAAQQAAKANGLNPHANLGSYIMQLQNRNQFQELTVENYRWVRPYTELLGSISNNGVAVFPNIGVGRSPLVYPPELEDPEFYLEILRHGEEIAAGDPPVQSSWHPLREFVKQWKDSDYARCWWDIDYNLSDPRESEIYSLGLLYQPVGSFENFVDSIRALVPDQTVYRNTSALPAGMRWSRYNQYWYPSYFRSRYPSYDSEHYSRWFGGETLRKPIREEYRYEGPAAYAEGYVNVDLTARFDAAARPQNRFGKIVRDRGSATTRIGTRRNNFGDTGEAYDYRPGAIAKALGSLDNRQPPIAVPLVLPVFDRISLMPTYMPIPYGFRVLRVNDSVMEFFLRWLAGESSLTVFRTPPPAGSDPFLAALRLLEQGKTFRYYGWNPNFDESAFDRRWKDQLKNYDSQRQSIVYSQQHRTGPGWLQEPQRFPMTTQERVDPDNPAADDLVTDHINGGIARRVFPATGFYYVVDSRGHVVNNDEPDPTRIYYQGGGSGSGGGFGGTNQNPDTAAGPPRL